MAGSAIPPNAFIIQPVYSNGQGNPQQGSGDRVILLNSGVPLGNAVSNAFFSADGGFGQASAVNTVSSLKSFSADGRFDEGSVTSDAVRQTKQQFHVENLSPLVSLSTCASGVSGGFNSDQMPHNVNLAGQYAGSPFFNYHNAPYPSARSQYHHGNQHRHGFHGHQSFVLPGAPGVAMGGARQVGYNGESHALPLDIVL